MDPRLPGVVGFAAAAVAWLALAVLLVVRQRGNETGRLLLVAVGLQVAWASSIALALVPIRPAVPATSILEGLRSVGWIVLLLHLTRTAAPADAGYPQGERARQYILVLAATLASASIAFGVLGASPHGVFTIHTVTAIVGLVCVEQVYRNTSHAQRWALKFLAIALAALFAFDLLMYSEAMLYGRMNGAWWTTRGFANAALVPLIAIAAARNPQWRLDIGVSRQLVFHSASLLVAGAYLVVVAAGGYYVRFFGGQWGEVAQALLLFAASIGLAIIATSGATRARLRVLLSKHFFSYRFDYRDEWLRLTRTLAENGDDSLDLPQRLIRALGQPVESAGGAVWLHDGNGYSCAATTAFEMPRSTIGSSEPLVDFLSARDWVIDVDDCRAHPERYDGLRLPAEIDTQESAWIIVPLLLGRELLGFVLLVRPLAPLVLDWEVRDLLKTSARQAASYVGVQRAIEDLVQARQFESFNRMSAFVVHDLKNLVAQLGLMNRNAERHRDNPEFQTDMLATAQNVMERMQALLLQLRAGVRPVDRPTPIPLADALTGAVSAKRGLRPELELAIDDSVVHAEVYAHRDRVERVIGHLVQNAAEASSPSDTIRVRARRDGTDVLIEVEDKGKGMSEDFVRGQLFRPFVSTKTHGMGIGAFESREYVRELGGALEVRSREGAGTVFTIRLPLVVEGRSQATEREWRTSDLS